MRRTMIRKQVYLEAHQDRALKARARQLGVTEAELIRRSLDHGLRDGSPRRPDPAAWQDILRFLRRRMRRRLAEAPRQWRRADLYDR